ncbi:MAG: DUF1573 domain-containing protein [Spirochaetales bacterium]|nr:DUF1573 domain-containing protein [Spirochaetales bacterium]
MKKHFGRKTILFFFAILLIAGCGDKTTKGSAIRFHKLVHNFGTVDEGTKVPFTFSFSNSGSEPLIIEGVYPACGCTIAGEYDKEVKPGKQGGIPIILDTMGFQGHTAKTVRVDTNIPDQKSYTLTIEGTVIVQVAVNPRTLILGRIIDKAASLSGNVIITNNTGAPMEITDIIPPNDNTSVKLSVIEKDKEYSLDITVKPPYKEGQVTETIILKTNLERIPNINVGYSYFLAPVLDVKPTEVYINPDQIPGGGSVREIYIYTGLNIPLEITNISFTYDKNIEYSIEETNKGELYKIILQFKPGFTFPSDAPIYITFQILNAPDSPVYTVPIKNAKGL